MNDKEYCRICEIGSLCQQIRTQADDPEWWEWYERSCVVDGDTARFVAERRYLD